MKGSTVLIMLLLATGFVFAIQPVENWTLVTVDTYTPGAAGAYATMGGNVSGINMNSNASTERWAGFYGNLTGNIVLAHGNDNMFYTWTWDEADGRVCAVVDNAFAWASVQAATAANIDTAWGFASGSDQAVDTFVNAGTCAIDFISGTVTSDGAPTGPDVADSFETCVVADTATPAVTNDIGFCVETVSGGTTFDGDTGDYEVIVATDETAGENYYFWLEME